jgi:uncharacterized protein (TIGR02466 family)
METVNLFSIPIYKFKFDRHKELKPSFMEYVQRPESTSKNSGKGRTLLFTNPNLHVEPVFEPFMEFAKESLHSVMEDLGFHPNIQFTGMWATRHLNNGSHHRHTHGNAFLAGVYYLHGNEENSGTTFYNTHKYHQAIIPARIKDKHLKMHSAHSTKFEEGALWIFPAWLEHSTGVNNAMLTNTVRTILSFNTMPLGPTNHDEFDRYDYPQCDIDNMLTDRDDRYKILSNKQKPETVSKECTCENCSCNRSP